MTNCDPSTLLHPAPSALERHAFIEAYGGVYEDTPWVAETLWPNVSEGALDEIDAMQNAMRDIVNEADPARQLALLRAHPELAGRAAIAGELTEASTSEQSGAGLDQCTPEEFAEFNTLNATYGDKFGFPFIIAVTGLTRQDILNAFRDRIANDRDKEFAQALAEVHKIAHIRLTAMTTQ